MKQLLYSLVLLVLLLSVYLVFNMRNQYTELNNVIYQQSREIQLLRDNMAKLKFTSSIEGLPTIYVITPTYARNVQKAELVRLQNAFRLVPNLHWIIVEDSSTKTSLVKNLLREFPQNSTHLNILTPQEMKIQPKESWWKKPRGVLQRNLALSWLRENIPASGVLYFADDDNTYSVELFEEIRNTEKVSVLPVGLVGGVLVEKPRVSGGKVVGWDVGWGAERPFATDMAGFAVNLQYFKEHKGVQFLEKVRIGFSESEFLKLLVSLEQLEPVSIGRVLVWHTRTEKPNLNRENEFKRKNGKNSDYGIEI